MNQGTYRGPLSEQNISMGSRRFRFDGLKLGVDGPSNLVIAASAPSTRPLDANLPQDTENAVLIAVKQETDPLKLQAFAQSLLPQYPSAASVLMARMASLIAGNTTSTGVGDAIAGNGLASGQSLSPGQSVFSPGGGTELRLQTDGNLVLYHGKTPLWNTGAKPGGTSVTMQPDGNLVYATWSCCPGNHVPGSSLAIQDDGNAVVSAPGGRPVWSTQTQGFKSQIQGGGFNLFKTIKTVAQDAVKVGPLAFIPGAGAAIVLASAAAAAGPHSGWQEDRRGPREEQGAQHDRQDVPERLPASQPGVLCEVTRPGSR